MRSVLPALAVALGLAIADSAIAEDIKIGGSGAPSAALKPVAEAFHKQHPAIRPLWIGGLGTRGGIRAAADGSIDVGLASRVLTPDEATTGIVQIELARTPFLFATSVKNNARRVTLQEIVQMYAGKVDTWPDGSRLRLVLRPPGDSDTVLLRSLSDDLRRALIDAERRPGMVMAVSDDDSADSIEQIPGAIGTLTLAQILAEKRPLRPLVLDGVEPSVENAAAGRYPLQKRFYLIVRKAPTATVQQFIAFATSAQAHAILKQYGQWIESPERRSQPGGVSPK